MLSESQSPESLLCKLPVVFNDLGHPGYSRSEKYTLFINNILYNNLFYSISAHVYYHKYMIR